MKYKTLLLFLALLAVIYFPLFLHLDYMPFRMWDESILGVNALEMMENQNYLVTYFWGEPDILNCKPPLMIWLIVIASKLIGFSELSVRLPSAIAALALCIYLFFALKKYSGSSVFPFLVVVVLVTCQGYTRNHVIRTGEYDSLLVLFSTIFSLHFFFAVEASDEKARSKSLLLFFVFLTLAVLTKGIACMMQAPGLLLYALFRKKVIVFLKMKSFYLGVLIFLLLGLSYYFIREIYNPGYLNAVWINELGGRFGQVNDGNAGGLGYYLKEIRKWQFIEYLAVFPLALILAWRYAPENIRRLLIYATVNGAVFLLVISISQTKLPHYDAPLFPYLAIITAFFFYFLYTMLVPVFSKALKQDIAMGLAFVCVAALLVNSYSAIISKVYFPKGDYWEEGFSMACRYFQDAATGKINTDGCKAVFKAGGRYGENTVLNCYEYSLKQKGIFAPVIYIDDAKAGDKVVVFDEYLQLLLEQKFETEWVGYHERSHGTTLLLRKERV